MTSRERVLAAIDRRPVDRVPTDYWGTAEAGRRLMTALGAASMAEVWRRLDIDKILGVMPGYLGPVIREEGLPARDFFGVEYREISYGGGLGSYFEIARCPLAEYESVAAIERTYRWPTAADFDFSRVPHLCREYPDYAKEGGYMAPFYVYTNIRGMERSLLDLAEGNDIAYYCIERISTFLLEFHTALFEAAAGGIDIAQVTDDFGSQHGLLISTGMFDRYFAAWYRRFVDLTRRYGIRVFHHDDGAIMEIIPRLLDVGIDVLNPIQWHLPGMDLHELKRRFGGRIAFHGGIDNQHVLPFGTPAEVEAEVIACVNALAADGTGYILAPCHNIQANTPPENIITMYRAAREYGGG